MRRSLVTTHGVGKVRFQEVRQWCDGSERVLDGERAVTAVAVGQSKARGRLMIVNGPCAGSSVPITAVVTTIGRHRGCGIVLDDGTVSRHHAVVHCHDDGYSLADAGSANGTYLNGRSIRLANLGNGDEITIGTAQLTFRVI